MQRSDTTVSGGEIGWQPLPLSTLSHVEDGISCDGHMDTLIDSVFDVHGNELCQPLTGNTVEEKLTHSFDGSISYSTSNYSIYKPGTEEDLPGHHSSGIAVAVSTSHVSSHSGDLTKSSHLRRRIQDLSSWPEDEETQGIDPAPPTWENCTTYDDSRQSRSLYSYSEATGRSSSTSALTVHAEESLSFDMQQQSQASSCRHCQSALGVCTYCNTQLSPLHACYPSPHEHSSDASHYRQLPPTSISPLPSSSPQTVYNSCDTSQDQDSLSSHTDQSLDACEDKLFYKQRRQHRDKYTPPQSTSRTSRRIAESKGKGKDTQKFKQPPFRF